MFYRPHLYADACELLATVRSARRRPLRGTS